MSSISCECSPNEIEIKYMKTLPDYRLGIAVLGVRGNKLLMFK